MKQLTGENMSNISKLLEWINKKLEDRDVESQDSDYAYLVGIEMGIKMTLKELKTSKG